MFGKVGSKVKVLKHPSQVFYNILRTGQWILLVVGANISDPNYRMNAVTYFVMVCIVSYWALSTMTILKLFAERWTILLEASCMSATVIQASTKLFGAVHKSRCFAKACETMRNIFNEFERKDQRHYEALDMAMKAVMRIMTTMAFWYSLTIIGIFITPFAMLIYNGQRYNMLPFLIPFLDIDTDNGYWLTLAIHAVFVLVGVFGLCAGDFVVIFPIVHIALIVNIFKLKVRILNEILDNEEKRELRLVDEVLVDLMKWHQLYIDFTSNIKEILSIMVTVQIPTAGLAIAVSVFIIMTSNWPGAYTYLFYAIFNLYSYCILGTKVDNWNDELCDEIYNIFWYNMNARQQKMIRLMLMQAQTQDTLTIAGFLPLSVATGLQVTKLIYSFSMFLIEFVLK